jgi:hypothetical protein
MGDSLLIIYTYPQDIRANHCTNQQWKKTFV